MRKFVRIQDRLLNIDTIKSVSCREETGCFGHMIGYIKFEMVSPNDKPLELRFSDGSDGMRKEFERISSILCEETPEKHDEPIVEEVKEEVMKASDYDDVRESIRKIYAENNWKDMSSMKMESMYYKLFAKDGIEGHTFNDRVGFVRLRFRAQELGIIGKTGFNRSTYMFIDNGGYDGC